jgi:hypothetical protein
LGIVWGDGEGYGAALKPVAVVSAAPGDLSYILSYSSMNTSGCWYGSWRKTLFGSGGRSSLRAWVAVLKVCSSWLLNLRSVLALEICGGAGPLM